MRLPCFLSLEEKMKYWTRSCQWCLSPACVYLSRVFCRVAPLWEITHHLSSPTSCLPGPHHPADSLPICSWIPVRDTKYLGTTKRHSFCLSSAIVTYRPHKHTAWDFISSIPPFTKSFLLGTNINSLKSQAKYVFDYFWPYVWHWNICLRWDVKVILQNI